MAGERCITDFELTYYTWLTNIVGLKHHTKLLQELYLTPFRWVLEMDGNRIDDGLELRYRFGYSVGMTKEERDTLRSIRPCSILEVMAAMALRCEEEYMHSGDDTTTQRWFYHMIASLGLMGMNDAKFDEAVVQEKLNKMMDRDYSPNGLGGLFFIPNYPEDLRTVELWYQMLAFLDYYIYGGE